MSYFTRATSKVQPQSCCLIYANSGVGKTHFAARWCPEPIYFILLDGRSQTTIARAVKEHQKKIYKSVISIPNRKSIIEMSSQEIKIIGQRSLDALLGSCQEAVDLAKNNKCRTICLDTSYEADQIFSYAVQGMIDLKEGDFGRGKRVINQHILSMYNVIKESPLNFVVLARAKSAPWVNKAPTGLFVPEVFKPHIQSADWVGYLDVSRKNVKEDPVFTLQITKPGANIFELNKVYNNFDWGEMGPFAYTCAKQYPGIDPEAWMDRTMKLCSAFDDSDDDW